ncbi:MAG: ABC-2 family transporter protein [Ktedonobacteraceae bacterium]
MRIMRALTKKIGVWLAIGFAQWSAYRFMILVWMLAGTVPLIMLAIWINKAQLNGGSLGGFTPQRFAAYFLAAWLSRHIVIAWVAMELDRQIRSGELSMRLLRPFNPFWEHLLLHFSEKFVRIPLMLIVVVAGILIVPGTRVVNDVGDLVLYIVIIHIAFLIRFLISYCIGVLSFWLDQATALEGLYAAIAVFASGEFAPLDFYPPSARAIIELTPFPYLLYYPVRILIGAASPAEIVHTVTIQLLWVVVFSILAVILWNRGLIRYGAAGS